MILQNQGGSYYMAITKSSTFSSSHLRTCGKPCPLKLLRSAMAHDVHTAAVANLKGAASVICGKYMWYITKKIYITWM